MREVTQKIYQFNELKPEIQKKIIDKHRQENTFFDEMIFREHMNYMWEELLRLYKIEPKRNEKLYYNLNHCQGDGVCFVGGFQWNDYYVKITHQGHYYHEKSVDFQIEDNEGNDVQEDVYSEFQNLFENICGELEDKGYSYLDETETEEYIKQNIEINEYEYYEDGRMF